MLYIDFLDSVRSAYPWDGEDNWWRPVSNQEQELAIGIAHMLMKISLLHGETIILSNNQAMDSVAFFKAMEHIVELDDLLWPPLAISIFGFGKKITSDTLLELVISNIDNDGFHTSAWVGMDKKTRENIVANITRQPRLDTMLVNTGVDNTFLPLMQEQATALHFLYGVLQKWHSPNEVLQVAGKSEKFIWGNLKNVRKEYKDIPKQNLRDIKKYLYELHGKDKKYLEGRSYLYQALANIDIDAEQRDVIDSYVNRFYNEKLGDSVTLGRGVFTYGDLSRSSELEEQVRRDEIADARHDPKGIVSQLGIEYYSNASMIESMRKSFSWENVKEILKDKEFQKEARDFQIALRNAQSANDKVKQEEAIHKHRELIATRLGKIATVDSGGLIILFQLSDYLIPTSGAVIGSGVGAVVELELGGFDGKLTGGMAGAAAGQMIGASANTIVKGIGEIISEKAVAGRIRRNLKKSVKIKN